LIIFVLEVSEFFISSKQMNLVEKIYACQTCLNYSKAIGGKLHEEFMSLAIEKILNTEINESYIVCYKSYFYSILLNVKRDYYKKNSHLLYVEDYQETTKENYEDNYKIALKQFITKDFKDESKRFYQDLIILWMRKSKASICKSSGINERKLEVYLERAKNLIRDEYNNLISA
jgi:hypothetical protein